MGARLTLVFYLLILVVIIPVAVTQGAPGQIKAALNDLSSRLGRAIVLSNLSNWRWEQQNFADAAMGCETAPGGGGAVLGYKFLLTYINITYDYRVSHDSSRVIFCGEMNADQAAAAQAAEDQYVNRLCPETAEPAPYMRSRINVGMDAEVVQDFVNLRVQPSTSSQILLQIPAGLPIQVSAGPECADGIVWWYALAGNQTGYVAEGQNGAYLVQPAQPVALPDRVVLTSSNIRSLQEVARLEGNFWPQHDWSANGLRLFLPGAAGSDSIWLFQLTDTVLTPEFVELDDALVKVAARPASAQLLYGTAAGSLHLLEIETVPELDSSERLFLNAHGGPISAMAFSPDGVRFVSAGRVAFTPFENNRDFAAIVWDLPTISQITVLSGHQDLIGEIAFSADGATIVTGAADGTLRYWDAETGVNLQTVELGAPVAAVNFSGDGRTLAVGLASDGANLRVYDAATRAQVAALAMPGSGVASLAFSSNSNLIAAGAAGNIFTVWDAQTYQPLLTSAVEGDVTDISFSPDGTLIAVSLDSYKLALFSVPYNSG